MLMMNDPNKYVIYIGTKGEVAKITTFSKKKKLLLLSHKT